MQRRRFLLSGAAASLPLLGGSHAMAQGNPSRIIKLISQDAPGGGIDLRLREFSIPLGKELGVTPIIENKPGGAGQIMFAALLNAPADGNTMMLANATMTIIPSLYRKSAFSPLRDFTPVAYSGLSPIGLAIPASRPEKTLKEWMAYIRTQKGKVNYGSGGVGTVAHLYGDQISDELGLDAVNVPNKNIPQLMPDLVTGQLHYMMLDIFSLRPYLQKGDLRLLAVTGDERVKYMPEVPTFGELGHKGYDRMGWTAYYVRSGTPGPIVDKLASAINRLNASPEWAAKREVLWSTWKPMSVADLRERVRTETEAWAVVVKRLGIQAD